jgi:hypothetical protein
MLILETKPQAGATFSCNDYSSEGMAHYRRHHSYLKVEKKFAQEEFRPVGCTLYPEGTTVKDALLLLSESRQLFNSTNPEWLAWLQDRSDDATEGEELVSTFNPTIYRLRQATEGDRGNDTV